jgi:uncharacterized Ntn-hydrolase superfamily protein
VTYSIVARDPGTGLLGVAVQTAMFAAGASVPWARAGVGAVATQANTEGGYGPRCLDAISGGATAPAALAQAQAADEAALLRQVGVVAADGSVAAMTGEWCIDHAGHLLGDGFAVQANMMASPAVWPAMAEAYQGSPGPFPRRLLAALEAGQAAGGDARGMMAAALVVVEAEPCDPWAGRLVDLRVDRSSDPLAELRRLLDASYGYDGFGRAVGALFSGDPAAALVSANEGLSALPGEENLRFVRAGALAASGDNISALAELRALIAARPSWATIIRSFAAKGLLTMPPPILEELLGE